MKYQWGYSGAGSGLSLPAWGAWVEIGMMADCLIDGASLPAWGAWVEIPLIDRLLESLTKVAPRMGSVG